MEVEVEQPAVLVEQVNQEEVMLEQQMVTTSVAETTQHVVQDANQ
jgi:hypothetical protein